MRELSLDWGGNQSTQRNPLKHGENMLNLHTQCRGRNPNNQLLRCEPPMLSTKPLCLHVKGDTTKSKSSRLHEVLRLLLWDFFCMLLMMTGLPYSSLYYRSQMFHRCLVCITNLITRMNSLRCHTLLGCIV